MGVEDDDDNDDDNYDYDGAEIQNGDENNIIHLRRVMMTMEIITCQ